MDDCPHPAWSEPNPLPPEGTACPACGVRYRIPDWLVQSRTPDPRHLPAGIEPGSEEEDHWILEALRAIALVKALTEEADSGEMSRYGSSVAKRRVIRRGGLALHGDDLDDLLSAT